MAEFFSERNGLIGSMNYIIVEDLREIKEPTIRKGDTISFYGSPDGLGVLRTYDPNRIVNNTIDKTEVPRVLIKYNAN